MAKAKKTRYQVRRDYDAVVFPMSTPQTGRKSAKKKAAKKKATKKRASALTASRVMASKLGGRVKGARIKWKVLKSYGPDERRAAAQASRYLRENGLTFKKLFDHILYLADEYEGEQAYEDGREPDREMALMDMLDNMEEYVIAVMQRHYSDKRFTRKSPVTKATVRKLEAISEKID